MMRLTMLLLCGIMMSACGTRELQVTAAPAQIPITQAADPTPVQMAPVNLRVVTSENLEEFLTEMRTSQGNDQFVIVTMQMRDYENLILNLAELRRYLEQQQHVILFYRGMTAPRNSN
jgi:hypothetical protein